VQYSLPESPSCSPYPSHPPIEVDRDIGSRPSHSSSRLSAASRPRKYFSAWPSTACSARRRTRYKIRRAILLLIDFGPDLPRTTACSKLWRTVGNATNRFCVPLTSASNIEIRGCSAPGICCGLSLLSAQSSKHSNRPFSWLQNPISSIGKFMTFENPLAVSDFSRQGPCALSGPLLLESLVPFTLPSHRCVQVPPCPP